MKGKIIRFLNSKVSIVTKLSLFLETNHFFCLLSKFNASVNTDNDMNKMQYTILRESHVIEKGMSMRNPRLGFGQDKVTLLLKRLDKYIVKYGNKDLSFVVSPLFTIKRYIDYTKENGVDIDYIEVDYLNILQKYSIEDISSIEGGIYKVNRDDIINEASQNFEKLLYSRHSVRYFKNKAVSIDIINKALELAQRTPSACNRQAWATHVFFDDNSYELLQWQGGANGFEREIRCSVLVTANLKAFLYYEPFQLYVDGGMYAMNLLNAFHSLGMATIPLSCGFSNSKLKKLKTFNIPENEVPIVIIGVGHQLESYNVAVSQRKDIILTNCFH